MKKFSILLMVFAIFTATITPKKAHAVEPGVVISVGLAITAVGAGIYVLYQSAKATNEISQSSADISGAAFLKREYMVKLQDDAYEFLAGEQASPVLAKVMAQAKIELKGKKTSDKNLAKAVIENTEKELASI